MQYSNIIYRIAAIHSVSYTLHTRVPILLVFGVSNNPGLKKIPVLFEAKLRRSLLGSFMREKPLTNLISQVSRF